MDWFLFFRRFWWLRKVDLVSVARIRAAQQGVNIAPHAGP
jgi:hypothetical protein